MAVAAKQNALELVRRLVPINTLDDDALLRLMEQVAFETLEQGDYLFREGDRENYNAYLLSGKVALQVNSRDVDIIVAGSDTARFPLAHQIPRKFSVVARTKAQIVRVDNRKLSEMINQSGSSNYEVSDFDAEATDDWMSQLLQSRVFQQIPAANIQAVMMHMKEQVVLAGEVIIRQGEEGDYFYLINKGTCSVLRAETPGGESVEVAQLGPGSSFGEEALLSGKPRGSTVVMLTDGVLLCLSKHDFIKYVKNPIGHKITFEAAQEQIAQGAFWLDVRPASVFAEGHLAGALNIPFDTLRQRSSSLEPEKAYVVYCDDGQLSTTAAYLLLEQGLQVSILDRGISGVDPVLLVTEQDDNVVVLPSPVRGEEEALSGRVHALQQKLAAAEKRGRDQFEQLKKLKLALNKARSRLVEMEKEKAAAGGGDAGLVAEIAALKARLARQQSENGKIDQRDPEAEKAALHHSATEAELKAAKATIKRLRQQLKSTEKALSGALLDRDRAKDELRSLQERYSANKRMLAESEQAVVELEEQLALQERRESGQQEAQKAAAARVAGSQAVAGLNRQDADEVALLREELRETITLREAAEKRVNELSEQLAGQRSGGEEAQVLQAELDSLTLALEEADASRDEAKARIQAIETERDGLAQALNQLQATLAAVQSELDRVRSQAKADHEALLQRLEETKKQSEGSGDSAEKAGLDSGGEAEISRLQQEIAALRHALAEREQRIGVLEEDLRRLEGQLEASNEAVSQHRQAMEEAQVDAEEAQFRVQEAKSARKQVEEALYTLQQQVESERPGEQGGADGIGPSHGRRRAVIGAALVGAVISFGVAEGLSLIGGGGELLSALFAR